MKKQISFTLCFFLCFSLSFAQTKESYFKYLVKRDSTVKSSLLYGSYGFAYAFSTKAGNIGSGALISGGINFARFFTKRFHVGVFGGIKTKGLFQMGTYSNSFANSLINNYDRNSFQGADTVLPSFFISKIKSGGFGGTTLWQYGVSINYPKKYWPLFKFYIINVRDAIEGSAYNSMMGKKEQDWIVLSYNGQGASFAFALGDFRKKINLDGAKIIISFYGERYSLENAKVEGMKLNSFIKEPFFNEFNEFYRFGISLSIGYF